MIIRVLSHNCRGCREKSLLVSDQQGGAVVMLLLLLRAFVWSPSRVYDRSFPKFVRVCVLIDLYVHREYNRCLCVAHSV